MLNKDKYEIGRELECAFQKFCDAHTCYRCPVEYVKEIHGISRCIVAWLELEEERCKTSKEIISDLIEEVNKGVILSRQEMVAKLLSHRDEIQKIWQAQDKEEMNNEEL